MDHYFEIDTDGNHCTAHFPLELLLASLDTDEKMALVTALACESDLFERIVDLLLGGPIELPNGNESTPGHWVLIHARERLIANIEAFAAMRAQSIDEIRRSSIRRGAEMAIDVHCGNDNPGARSKCEEDSIDTACEYCR